VGEARKICELVGVAERWGMAVAVERGFSVAVGRSGISLVAVLVGGRNPPKVAVGVRVGVSVITANSGTPPVSEAVSMPSKSRIMSNPIAGTEWIIVSTP
jgi:hypothetical protein